MQSTFLTLNSKDFIKGLMVAVLTTVISIVYTSLQAGNLQLDWKVLGMTALSSALAYITKNLFTNSTGAILKKEVSA